MVYNEIAFQIIDQIKFHFSELGIIRREVLYVMLALKNDENEKGGSQ